MNKKAALILTLALALPATVTLAQGPGGPPPGGPPPGGLPPGPPPDREQPGKRPPNDRERPPLPPMPILQVLDGDHDGIISAEEIKGVRESLAKLDKNKDGKLTPEEFLVRRPDGPPPGDREDVGDKPKTRNAVSDRNRPPEPFPGKKPVRDGDKEVASPKEGERPKDGPRERGDKPPRPPVPPLIAVLDADSDGVISADEIAGASKSLLTLDKNDDGQLGPREYMGRPRGDRPEGDEPKPPRPPKEEQ